jgi:hypothetical protein
MAGNSAPQVDHLPAIDSMRLDRVAGSPEATVPTVSDRIAQTVVGRRLEVMVEPIFHRDSYGYRPGRSALDAVETCRRPCWQSDWVIDLGIKKFFDSVPWDLMVKAVEANHRPGVGHLETVTLAGTRMYILGDRTCQPSHPDPRRYRAPDGSVGDAGRPQPGDGP